MLLAAQLARMRAVEEAAMPSSGTVYRPSYTSDGMGGQTTAYSAIGTSICRITHRGDAESVVTIGGQITPDLQWTIVVPYGTDVQEDDIVSSGSVNYLLHTVPDSEDWYTAIRCLGERYSGSVSPMVQGD